MRATRELLYTCEEGSRASTMALVPKEPSKSAEESEKKAC